ncbi:MAG: hypothetical protein Q7V20_04805 [Aquabacterium sp.]|uniref:hypothetical protein n=1 Tax=Aquabacterium sp. TaxID=1872578 RepID=UPI002726EBC1|nr:hypothetical protein [Aquabacterium sp.]MDO9002759.1 hypothetical protein [Aquabacterium sp.]
MQDLAVEKPPSWYRTVFLVAIFSAMSLALSWLIAPFIASTVALLLGMGWSGETPPALLALDMALSLLAFILGCYGAARLSRGHFLFAAAGVALVGWVVYFAEAGGVQGMLKSQYPIWYEFFPSHFSAALLAIYLVRRRKAP